MEEICEIERRDQVESFAHQVFSLLGGDKDPELSFLAKGIVLALAHLHLDEHDEHRSEIIKMFRDANHEVLQQITKDAQARVRHIGEIAERARDEFPG